MLPSRLKFLVPLLFMIALLGGMGVFVYHKAATLMESERWVSHTYDVIHDVTDVRQQLNDADVEYLFHLVNGNQVHARNVTQFLNMAKAGTQALSILTADNPNQTEYLKALAQHILDRDKFIQAIINKKAHGLPTPEVGTEICVTLRRNIHDDLVKIVAEERRLLEIRRNEKYVYILELIVSTAIAAIAFGAAFAFILGVFYSDLKKQEALDNFVARIKN